MIAVFVPAAGAGRCTAGHLAEGAQRETERFAEPGLQVVQDDPLPQRPRAHVDHGYVEGLHHRPGHLCTGDDLPAARLRHAPQLRSLAGCEPGQPGNTGLKIFSRQ